MAKNIRVTEDGREKNKQGVAKIRTSVTGAAESYCDWIPKDEVPLETLHVSEDGVYTPSGNNVGFDKVVASGIGNVIEGDLITKTITKNGTYQIADESGNPYGYSKIIVNVDTGSDDGDGGGRRKPVVGKDDDGNDTMVEDDDDGNIVQTALPTEIEVEIPPTKTIYDRYEEIDYSGIVVCAYISKAIHWLGTTTTAISEGSTNNVICIDNVNVSVSVGNGAVYSPAVAVTYRLVWSGTKWVKAEDYNPEKILWRSNKYPDGRIPFGELIFSVKRINSGPDDECTYETWKKSPFSDVQDILLTDDIHAYHDLVEVYGWKDRTGPYSGWIIGGGYPSITRYVEFFYRSDVSVYSTNGNVHILLRERIGNNNDYTLLVATDNMPDSHITDVEKRYLIVPPLPQTSEDIIYTTSPLHPEYYAGEEDYAGINLAGRSIFLAHDNDLNYNGETRQISISYDTFGYATYFDKRVYFTQYNTSFTPFFINGGTQPEEYSFVGGEPATNGTVAIWNYSVGYLRRNSTLEFNTIVYSSEESIYKQAWIMVYGEEEKRIATYKIEVPVQWKRPGDGKILETTVTLYMKDPDAQSVPSGGSGGGGGNQNYDAPQ